ncbi:MAG: dolichyl-phosphate beta-glucosyltransferase [Thermoanaerobaculia bacterium]
MDLSVVIPAYNEAERLGSSLERVAGYLRERGTEYEILVVDDGSADATAEVAAGFEDRGVRVLRQPRNHGKGAAVRRGVLASRGRRVLVSDADLSTPIEAVERLEAELGRADVVFGSRAVAGADVQVRQPLYRELMGKTFNLIIRILGVRGIKDTQCGFKLLDGEAARRLFERMIVDRFAFDVELVWLARREGLRVVEVGVPWVDSPRSRVHPIFDSSRMFHDVLTFRFRHWRRAKKRR